ncbi:hypothetical protein HOLleu_18632 [Holothuria leucospilota]|uniref:Uncharacterized protein n=1 Tax=Holothuria leucospilota TaxID=206669 RepID=A0A9Q1H997_HOLLE|nr:hypothetical protein HOLleu_18632 [Holothuria leucospilota]
MAVGSIFKVFGITRPGVEPQTFRLQVGCSNHLTMQSVSGLVREKLACLEGSV